MQHDVPRNGPLSGMIITAIAAVVTFPLAYFHDATRARFDRALGDDLASIFMLGAIVMGVHKLESLLTREYEQCPVYITQARDWGADPARAIFLTFVPTFVGMLLVVALALLGPPWHLAIITVWLAQGLHELHHTAKSLARRRIYPGLLSSLLFVVVQSGFLFPRWHDLVAGERGVLFDAYYLALPIVVLAYYFEDRQWIARTPRHVWDPGAGAAEARMILAQPRRLVRSGPSGHA